MMKATRNSFKGMHVARAAVAVLTFCQVAAARTDFTAHNPHDVAVHTVHLVQSAHLDIGCKTFGCSVRMMLIMPCCL